MFGRQRNSLGVTLLKVHRESPTPDPECSVVRGDCGGGAIAPVHPRKHGLSGCGGVGLPRVFLAFSLDLIPAVTTLFSASPLCPLLLPAPTLLMPSGRWGHTG